MILHIKPTAKKDQIFRFKSNFIRFLRSIDSPKASPVIMIEGIESNGDGVLESINNIIGAIESIRQKHSKICSDEIKTMLIEVARELSIPLD